MIKCPVCDSNLTSLWSDRLWLMPDNQREFHYRRCSDCGTVFCDPLPTIQELAAYYRNHYDYGWFEEHRLLKKIQAAHRWHRMASIFHKYHVHQGQLFDIGCGHGFFLSSAKRAKWKTVGADYPSLATRYAREKLGLLVAEGDFRTLVAEGKIEESQFDFVTAWHCLEHDTEPSSFLEGINTVLSPKGKVLIAVPNAEPLGMKLEKDDRVWCQQPYVHVTHFTIKSLLLLARRSGLNVLAVWTRDTWDAHPAYDAYMAPRIKQILKHIRPFNHRLAFWIEEGMRMACYTASCHNHWLRGRERTDGLGSELLLLAEQVTTKE